MYETLIVDGTDLATVASCVESLDGLYQVGMPRGDNPVIPGVDGEVYIDKPFGAQVIELGITLQGSTTADFNLAFRVLKKLIQPGKQLSLERRISFTAGNESHFATGEWASGLNASVSLMRFGRVTLGLKIHEGLWYAGVTGTLSYSGSNTWNIGGEARTHRITITMPAGGSLTNSTTGHTVSNNLTGGGDVTIDVLGMTATQGGNDVSGSLSWNKRYPFRLVPGTNATTSAGGSGSIVYTEAYL